MSEERNRIAWEPWAACVCFVVAGISLVIGFVFTTRWLLDDHIILGGHFMDLNDRKIGHGNRRQAVISR
jgi:hypothetical protein